MNYTTALAQRRDEIKALELAVLAETEMNELRTKFENAKQRLEALTVEIPVFANLHPTSLPLLIPQSSPLIPQSSPLIPQSSPLIPQSSPQQARRLPPRFQQNASGEFINPNTSKPFLRGQVFNDQIYVAPYSSRLVDGTIVIRPRFASKEAWNNTILKRSRTTQNPELHEAVLDSLFHGANKRLKPEAILDYPKKLAMEALKIGRCQSSFPPLSLIYDKPGSAYSASFDRIDSENKNYSTNNVRIVTTGINLARNRFCDEDVIENCSALVRFLNRRKQRRSNSAPPFDGITKL